MDSSSPKPPTLPILNPLTPSEIEAFRQEMILAHAELKILAAQKYESRVKRRFLLKMSETSELRVDCEFGSTGLWNGAGHNLSYEQVGLPIDLEQRVRHLQAEFDEKAAPYSPLKDDDDFWDWVNIQEMAIARDIQQLAGDATRVVLWRGNRWVWINELI